MPPPRPTTREASLSQGEVFPDAQFEPPKLSLPLCSIICFCQEEFGYRLPLTRPFTSPNQPSPTSRSLAGWAPQAPQHLHSPPLQFLRLNWESARSGSTGLGLAPHFATHIPLPRSQPRVAEAPKLRVQKRKTTQL